MAGTGSCQYDFDNVSGVSASLNQPLGLAVDAHGNLYIADQGNNRIRNVAADTGIITTVAGNGSLYYNGDNIPATSAGIWQPAAVALDAAGNLYTADLSRGRIRKVSAATGTITTLGGNGSRDFGGDGGRHLLALPSAGSRLGPTDAEELDWSVADVTGSP